MPINIANTENKDYSLDRDIKSLSKHFKVQESVIKKGYLYQEYSFSFPINKGYVVAGRANGPLEALIYKSEDESYTGDYDDIIKISNSNENSSTNAVGNDLKKTMDSYFDKTMSELGLSLSLKSKYMKKLEVISKKAATDFSYILDEMEEQ